MIYVILGQTASGKTDLALALARELQLPLIGADAFQMYDELNIGSAKPQKDELAGIDYHLIGDVSVKEHLSVKYYQDHCRALLDKYAAEGKDVILSGGTFLYVRAALYPYEFPEEEAASEDGLESLSKEEAYKKLQELDPQAAQALDMNNFRRVIRALRIARSGKKKSELAMKTVRPIYPAKFFAIQMDTEEGNRRIEARVKKMMSAGLLEEVKQLMSSFEVHALSAFQAIGYKEAIAGLEKGQSTEEITQQIIIDTRQYAKRQRTFLRHQFPSIHWLKPEEIHEEIAFDCERRKRNRAALAPEALNRIEMTKAAVIGLGGVGSIVADGLVRLGVSDLTLIDKDKVEASNLNRQILYDKDDLGEMKAAAAKKHLLKLDPSAEIEADGCLYDDALLEKGFDFVFECIDDAPAKARIAVFCQKHGIKEIAATGSALRTDSTKFRIGDLLATGEPLAKKFKAELKSLGFTDFAKVKIAYSAEPSMKRTGEELGSDISAPNAEGLAMLSFFISSALI
jgi:tRNA dimethylallyltransferase